jgi:hypothetical protein
MHNPQARRLEQRQMVAVLQPVLVTGVIVRSPFR